jgi:hypothetical protein
MELMVYGAQPSVEINKIKYRGERGEGMYPILRNLKGFKPFTVKLAKFQHQIEELAKTRAIGKGHKEKYIFTRRGLMEFLGYLETKSFIERTTGQRRAIADHPKEIVLRGLQYYFLDKIREEEDRKKVRDLQDSIGISDSKWTVSLG